MKERTTAARVLSLQAGYDDIRRPLERILEEFPLDLEGRSVLLKPNMVGQYGPETHVNTHPGVIRALVELLRERGASVTVGDNPGTTGYGMVEKCGRVSGIAEGSLGAFESIATEVERVPLPGAGTRVSVSRKVLDSDVFISLPKFKTHTFTRITGAVKNSFGIMVGGDKARLHLEHPGYRAFSEVLVDVYAVRIPDLVIVDAVVGLQGNGPTNKSLYHAGRLLASDNGVSLDAVMSQMMGIKPRSVKMLEVAAGRGLGEIDTSRIETTGDVGRLKGFRRPVPGLPQLFGGTWINTFFPDIGRPRFEVDEAECSLCGSCAEACPGDAIEVGRAGPVYDYSRCIACYCCMELCPRQAIELHETFSTRLYRLLGYR
ncbi:MAG: DUF362 domain-containing protein [Actinobacteria bacterium]|nr:DUF362 domain-containing protein [Actinomycetota bacterium]MBU1944069.1 DUF362 domain-containing protein [Actinomycetota bacterium]MBU2687229.1 DUF362 domain-containing protein [Actinomycetota bacterium]